MIKNKLDMKYFYQGLIVILFLLLIIYEFLPCIIANIKFRFDRQDKGYKSYIKEFEDFFYERDFIKNSIESNLELRHYIENQKYNTDKDDMKNELKERANYGSPYVNGPDFMYPKDFYWKNGYLVPIK